jgi:hypothetical protein
MTDKNNNRGYQGPAFNRNGRRRPSAILDDEPIVEDELINNRSHISIVTEHSNNNGRRSSHLNANSSIIVGNESNISRTRSNGGASSIRSGGYRTQGGQDEIVAPLHDPLGKPLLRHGTETIGDLLLNPLKEFQLHQKRNAAYEVERASWNEKHPASIASKKDVDQIADESIV